MLNKRILISKLVRHRFLLSLLIVGLLGIVFIVLMDTGEGTVSVYIPDGLIHSIRVRNQNYTIQNNLTWNASQHTNAAIIMWSHPSIDYFPVNHHVFEFNNLTWSIGTGTKWIGVTFQNQLWYWNISDPNYLSTTNALFIGASKSRVNLSNMSIYCNVSSAIGYINNFLSGCKFWNISNSLVKFLDYKSAYLFLPSNSIMKINNTILSGCTITNDGYLYCDGLTIMDCGTHSFYKTKMTSIKNLRLIKNYYGIALAVDTLNLKNIQFIDNTYDFYVFAFSKHVNLTDCYFNRVPRLIYIAGGFNGGHLHLNNNLNVNVSYPGNGTGMKNCIVSVKRNDSVEVYNKTTDSMGLSGLMSLEYTRYMANAASCNFTYTVNIFHPGYQTQHIRTVTNRYNGTGMNWTVSLNKSHTVSLFTNFVNCVGSLEYVFNGSGYNVYGNATGTSGVSLLVDNPNPGNSTTMYDTNFLQASSNGIGTCVDVSYQNFTVLSEANLGTGRRYENLTTGETMDDPIGRTFMVGQTWTSSYLHVLNKIKIKMYRTATADGLLTVCVRRQTTEYPGYPYCGNDSISNGTLDVSGVSSVYPGDFYEIPMSPVVLYPGVDYALYVKYPNVGGGKFVYLLLNDTQEISVFPVGKYISVLWAGSYWVWASYQTNSDMMFSVHGWNISANVSWNHIVNLTFSAKNLTGIWHNYSSLFAVLNGTVCVLNQNMTSNNTQYYWRVNWSTSEISEAGYTVFTFTTADRVSFFPMSKNNIALGAGIGCLFCVPLFFFIRRKKNTG